MTYLKDDNRKKHTNKYQKSGKFCSIQEKNTPFLYVESFKTLRTNVEYLSSIHHVKCIMVTSAVPDEGKSTTAINLAIALASNGRSVALVECDLRKPILCKYLKMERYFDCSEIKGLSSFLRGDASLEECIYRIKRYGISVILAGPLSPNPSELLNNNRMNAMIGVLKNRFDFVILDAPPVTVVTDAAVVGRVADGALLVVRSTFAPTRTVQLAKQRLEDVNIKIVGSVITCFDVKKSGWRTGYNYQGYEYEYGQDRSKQ